MIVAALRYKDRLYYQELENGQSVSFGSGKKDTIQVLDMEKEQIQITGETQGLNVRTKSPFPNQRKSVPTGSNIRIDAATGTTLMVSKATGKAARKLKLPYDGQIKIGRASDNDVIIAEPFVSGHHFILRIRNGNVRVEDCGSTNGLYLNGQRVQAAMMHFGDVLNILTIRIKLENQQLEFENVGVGLKIPVENRPVQEKPRNHAQQKFLYYRRSPRRREVLPQQCVVLDNPPKKGQEYQSRGGRGVALASSAAMIGANIAMTAASPQLAMARGMFLVPQTINFVYNFISGGKIEKAQKRRLEEYIRKREDMYRAYVADQQAKISDVANEQRRIITHDNPTAMECMNTAMRMDTRLWERMPEDGDFLDVRIGMGYENLCVDIKSRAELNGFRMEDDELEELCAIIAEENRIVDNVPARMPLRQCTTLGIVGDRSRAVHLVRNMLVSLTTQHCHQDVRVVGIFDERERAAWSSMRWLPHIWDEGKQFRFLSFDEKRAHNICEILTDILKKRQEQANSYGQDKTRPHPHYVLILGSRSMVERESLMRYLTQNDPSLGISAVFLFNDMSCLPRECRYILDLSDKMPWGYDRLAYNKKFTFLPDDFVSSSQFSKFARQLAAIQLENFETQQVLPGAVSFLQGYGVNTVEQLDIYRRWRNRQNYGSLATPIGIRANGSPFLLDIHPSGHGPHGLLAGTTGSGKSELLQTWILSMAVNYHPHDVNFVIIDYKGGGMANLMDKLPHVVGKITNIGMNINRSLISLKSELRRRQEILADYGVNSIEKYQKLYRSGGADQPMPNLIIVSDEFAELKKEEPEFMAELTSMARLGRSLGIHLVLATQKPTGVVNEQIDSNARFRICMKVNDISDSRELLKRPDAAKITQPGRAYVRVGEDELFELFQSYWSGAQYNPGGGVNPQQTNQVRIVDIDGQRHKTVRNRQENGDGIDELSAVVDHIVQVAQRAEIRKLAGPWLPELPSYLTLQQIVQPNMFNGEGWGQNEGLRIPVGIFDYPQMQKQNVLYMDLQAQGHYGIYGAPGTGKTTLLKTVVTSLAQSYTPEEVNCYVIDCGGRSMAALADLPHVGDVVLDFQEEKLRKLCQLLEHQIDVRKDAMFRRTKPSYGMFIQQEAKNQPAIVLVIDNIGAVLQNYPYMEQFLIQLSGEGNTYGIHLVYTARNSNDVRYKISGNVRGAIAFEQVDRSNYAEIIGRLPEGIQLPKVPGRAIIKLEVPVVFQSAVADDLQEQIQKMNRCWKHPGACSVPVMPDQVRVEQIIPAYQKADLIPVGLDCNSIEPVYLDMSKEYVAVIADAVGKGESLMQSVARLLQSKKENRIYLFDTDDAVLQPYGSEAYSYVCHRDEKGVSTAIDQILTDLETRTPETGTQVCILIQDVCKFADIVSDENRDAMERICRMAKNMGVLVIASGRSSELMSFQINEPLTKTLLNAQRGIALGGNAGMHRYFPMNLSYEERSAEIAAGNALMVMQGNVRHIRWMQ